MRRFDNSRLRRAWLLPLLVLSAGMVASGCASTGKAPDRIQVDDALRNRAAHGLRPEAGQPTLPPGVALDDGLAEDEAVAIALWNSPQFEASLADLSIARADLVDAGLLRNPIFSLLFPWGPKQLEWTLQFPIDVLWQRPRRVAAATVNVQAVAERLVSEGLTLVAEVRQAYVDAVAAERRTRLAQENAHLVSRIADIADARLRAGDISELEARAARSDALQVLAGLRTLEHEQDVSKVVLIQRMGFELPPQQLRLSPQGAQLRACGDAPALIEQALASRPDVRAAELDIEAAGRRAAWERSRIMTLVAALDANGQGVEGYEQGPGFIAEIPVLSRNQGLISRALAEMERASRNYLAVRMQVAAEVRTASIRVNQAQQAVQMWERDIVPSLEIEQRQAESAYKAGEVALLSLLDASRRLVQARTSQLEAAVNSERAGVLLDRSVGRACAAIQP
jgi:outer membrane protein, heavy metal efflux system